MRGIFIPHGENQMKKISKIEVVEERECSLLTYMLTAAEHVTYGNSVSAVVIDFQKTQESGARKEWKILERKGKRVERLTHRNRRAE